MYDEDAEHNILAVLINDAGHCSAEKLSVSWIQWQYPEAREENNRVLIEAFDTSIYTLVYSVEVASEIKIVAVFLV